jgi:hypothetical protein
MTASQFVLHLLAGRLLVWLLQTNGLSKPIWGLHPTLKEMSECDLCLGFWGFLAMAILTDKPMFDLWPKWFDCVVQAAISTFVVHLVRLGWRSKFGVTVI